MTNRNIKFADIDIAFHNETCEIAPSTNLPMINYIRAIAIMIINFDNTRYCIYVNNQNKTKRSNEIEYFVDGFYFGPDNGIIQNNMHLIKVNENYWLYDTLNLTLSVYDHFIKNNTFAHILKPILVYFAHGYCTIKIKKHLYLGNYSTIQKIYIGNDNIFQNSPYDICPIAKISYIKLLLHYCESWPEIYNKLTN